VELSTQRRLAADLLGVGVNRVWIAPEREADVAGAITKADIRRLIKDGTIKARPKKGISRSRARSRMIQRRKGRRRGPGSRKGRLKARMPKKEAWIRRVRPLRARLRELRENGTINPGQYRRLYLMVKGGSFRSKAHLDTYLKERGMMER
jgi:large subunit ribosomal protein L19e